MDNEASPPPPELRGGGDGDRRALVGGDGDLRPLGGGDGDLRPLGGGDGDRRSLGGEASSTISPGLGLLLFVAILELFANGTSESKKIVK